MDSVYLTIFYFEKLSHCIWRSPFAVNVILLNLFKSPKTDATDRIWTACKHSIWIMNTYTVKGNEYLVHYLPFSAKQIDCIIVFFQIWYSTKNRYITEQKYEAIVINVHVKLYCRPLSNREDWHPVDWTLTVKFAVNQQT